MATVTTLPRVAFVTSVEDFGPGGIAACPHCGALGRWVISFVTVDGEKRGAMKGCWKLFPKSELVAKSEELLTKERKEAEGIKGYRLNRWDKVELDAIHLANKGKITVEEAMSIIEFQERDKKAWMKKMGFRR